MATLDTAKTGQDGQVVHPVLLNTAKDGSGTYLVPLVDADGHIQVDALSISNLSFLDDVLLKLGTDADQAFLNRSTVLNANTALAGVLIGTPVSQALAANSLMISNVTSNGDIAMYVNYGGNSQQVIFIDASAKIMYLGFAGGGTIDLYGGVAHAPTALSGTPAVTGAWFNQATQTFTDNATAGSGTAAFMAFNAFAAPTLAATNALVTTTEAATVYIAGAPIAGANETIAHPYAMILRGNIRVGNDTTVDATIAAINCWDTKTITDNVYYEGLQVIKNVSKTSAVYTGAVIAVYGEPRVGAANTQNWTGAEYNLIGGYFTNCILAGATGVITKGDSIFINCDVGAATITSHSGIYIANPYVHDGGVITNNYAIYIGAQTAGSTLDYSIYSGGGLNYLAGNTGIGVAVSATQTLAVYQATATNYSIYSTGGLNYFAGHVGIGGLADAIADALLYLVTTKTITDNSGHYGIYAPLTYVKTSAAYTSTVFGMPVEVYIGATNTQNWSHATAGIVVYSSYLAITTGATGILTGAIGYYSRAQIDAGTVTTLYHYRANDAAGAGTVTKQVGFYVADMTKGGTDVGIEIAGADTIVLWLGSGADNTDAANGIMFGASQDTDLYRSGANALKTDDTFSSAGFLVGATPGVDYGPAAVTSITVVKGIVTAIS